MILRNLESQFRAIGIIVSTVSQSVCHWRFALCPVDRKSDWRSEWDVPSYEHDFTTFNPL